MFEEGWYGGGGGKGGGVGEYARRTGECCCIPFTGCCNNGGGGGGAGSDGCDVGLVYTGGFCPNIFCKSEQSETRLDSYKINVFIIK